MKPDKQKKSLPESKKSKILLFFIKNYTYLILISVGLLLYIKTISYSYSPLDDTLLIKNRMEWLLDKSNFSEVFTRGTFTKEGSHAPDYYRPILTLSFKADAIISNGKIGYFHFSNILLHIIASLLCFLVLKRFSISERNAFIFSLLFVVHPVFVHAVAWVPGRNDILLAIFSFASVFFYLTYAKENKLIPLVISLFFYLVALFTKENIVFLPLLLIAIDYLINNKFSFKKVIITGLGFGIVTIFWWMVRSSIVSTADVVYAINPFQAIVKSIAPLFLYIGKTVLPFNQSVLPNVSDNSYIPGIIVFAGFIFIAFRYRFKNYKLAFFGIIWFVIFLLIPLVYSTLTGEGLQYEHRLYVSMLGLILTFSQINLIIPKKKTVFTVIVLLFSIKTILRCDVYENTFSFASAAVSESPSLAMSHNMMGIEFNNMGEYTKAIEEYSQALKIEPQKYTALFNRASTFKNMKEYNLALNDYNAGLAEDSLNAKAIFDRGNVYFDLEKYDDAITDYSKAIEIYPQYSNAFNNRGNAHANLKQFKYAIQDYTLAIKYRSSNANAFNNRANVYSTLKEYGKALEDVQKAISLRPKDKDFEQNKNSILAEMKKMNDNKTGNSQMTLSLKEQELLPKAYELYKTKEYNKAREIFNDLYLDAKRENKLQNAASHYNNVSLCYIKMNNLKEAENVLNSIISFYPMYEKTYLNFGLLYIVLNNKKKAIDFYNKALEINPNSTKAKVEIQKIESQMK